MSCNGCRVLRKGCSDDCALRPCLQWIKTPEAQGNATVFLAKFYGRAGLVNLVNAGPQHLRHEIFRSLLYEACGRIINPIYGAAGLMWSGNWERCQSAVEAVLAGKPIMKVSETDDDVGQGHPIMPLKGCDIRHLGKNSNGLNSNFYNNNLNNNNNNIHRVRTTRNRFKRSGFRGKFGRVDDYAQLTHMDIKEPTKFSITGWDFSRTDDEEDYEYHQAAEEELKRAPSHDSLSVETVEPSLVNPVIEQDRVVKTEVQLDLGAADEEDADLVLDLSLGFYPLRSS
ncbi:OLC1v1032291C1 [Oldenlandia corymbosa var. corymbosa]|uniref:OLC1v1032291C1 n=1 Tax=Oldenlandia corymbosa var. corymbosa TaxID=529605 RepID=A0AAV1CKV8_OLDCO|nr:OLC1v1032291C1 [Oldenlandia corymbosa var. corymbosa]